MMRASILVCAMLAGCSSGPLSRLGGDSGGGGASGTSTAPETPVVTAPAPSAPPPSAVLAGASVAPASLDTVSEAEKEAARTAAAATAPDTGVLGEETVSLGDPTETGLWVKTALVSEEVAGTVRTGDGDAIAVTLRPLDGAGGAQISLSALQALGLPLAGLFPVTVARTG